MKRKQKKYYAVTNNEDGTVFFGSEIAIINYANMIREVDENASSKKVSSIRGALSYLTQKDVIIKPLNNLMENLKNDCVIYITEE